MRPLGCVRRGGRWHAYTAADLIALLSLPAGELPAPIDCDDIVVAELLERLEARGVELAPAGHDVLHVMGEPMTRTEARAVKRLRRELHAALLARHAAGPAWATGTGNWARPPATAGMSGSTCSPVACGGTRAEGAPDA